MWTRHLYKKAFFDILPLTVQNASSTSLALARGLDKEGTRMNRFEFSDVLVNIITRGEQGS